MIVSQIAKPDGLTYRPDMGWKTLPEFAALGKEQADMYRSARQENPAMARLLFRRIKEAAAQMTAEMWGAL